MNFGAPHHVVQCFPILLHPHLQVGLSSAVGLPPRPSGVHLHSVPHSASWHPLGQSVSPLRVRVASSQVNHKYLFPSGSVVKNPPAGQETQVRAHSREDPPGEGQRQPAPVFLPGESRGQESLVGRSPWAHRDSDPANSSRSLNSRGCPLVLGRLGVADLASAGVAGWPPQSGVPGGSDGTLSF